jgi:hypothetical protein
MTVSELNSGTRIFSLGLVPRELPGPVSRTVFTYRFYEAVDSYDTTSQDLDVFFFALIFLSSHYLHLR